MATWTRWNRGLAAGSLALTGAAFGAAGCGGSDSLPPTGGGGGGYGSGFGGGSSSGGSGPGPMLVVVDTGESFAPSSMQGGQGVGVFVEYQAGGHWALQWTCDTALTGLNCQFALDASLIGAPPVSSDAGSTTSPSITNVMSQLQSANAQVTQPSGGDVTATSTTFTGVDAMSFDAPAGATIVVDAKVNGVDNGSFLFFVQDGKVNGGYQGALSDPLMFQPSSP